VITDLQKAPIWKRASAGLFDLIITVVVAVGVFFLFSNIFDYNRKQEEVSEIYAAYEAKYGFNFLDVTEEMYNAYTDEEKANYDTAYKELIEDKDYLQKFNLVINLALLFTSLGILIGVLLVELIAPIIFHNGQTLGKKIFSLGVIKPNGVRIRFVNLFARTLIGKYAIEIMIPVYTVILLIFQSTNLITLLLGVGIFLVQIVLLIVNRNNAMIHDLVSYTVVVDMHSQMIFNSEEERIKYIEENAKAVAEKQTKTFK